MKRTLGFALFLVIVSLAGACSADKTANDNSNQRNGVVETNANVKNLNANNVPANVGVLTNDNGNKNTAGVRSINGNGNRNRP
jgi:hypothetical protein